MGPEADSLSYDVANRLAEEAIKKIFETAAVAQGLPGAVMTPHVKLYTEYAKRFFDVYRGAQKYEGSWAAMRDSSVFVRRYVEDVRTIVFDSAIPAAPSAGPFALFGALLDARAVESLKRERTDFLTRVEDVTKALDGVMAVSLDMLTSIAESIANLDRFVSADKPRNTFEQAYGAGSSATVRTDWCHLANQLISAMRNLRDHRDRWAKLGNVSPISIRIPAALDQQCAIF